MAVLNFLVGWFNGMGWPPCGRVMTHWFSIKERGTWMSFWNCAHNVGGALVGPMAVYGAMWFGSWFYGAQEQYYFLIGTYAFPAATAILIAILAYLMIRDTPQSCGLPSIEKWSGCAGKNYDAKKSEEVLSTAQISAQCSATSCFGTSQSQMHLYTWFVTDVLTGLLQSLQKEVSTLKMQVGHISHTRWQPSQAQSSAVG